MAKSSGLGDALIVDGVDLSGDTGGLQAIGKSRPTKNVTGIDKSGVERLHLRRNGRIDWAAHWNPAGAHAELSTLPTADRILSYLRGSTLGDPAASMVCKQLNYDGTEAADGGLDFTVQARSNAYGLEWGRQMTAGIRSDSSATDGSSYDWSSGSNFSMQGYLQVISFTGTDVTISLQHSSDDGVGDAFEDIPGAQFGQITSGPQAVRSTLFATTVERYIRASTTTSAGFTEVSFVVIMVRNLQAVSF